MSLMNDPGLWFRDLFLHAGLSYNLSSFLSTIALVLIVILLSWIANLVTKAIILKIVTRIVKKTTTTWDDIFLEQKVFTRLSHFSNGSGIVPIEICRLIDRKGCFIRSLRSDILPYIPGRTGKSG